MIDISRTNRDLAPNPEVLSRRLDQSVVLVHIGTNRIFELNETAGCAWELLGRGVDIDSIVDQLVDEFDVEPQKAADELKELIIRFRAEGLLIS